ncbi:MAG: CRISPR system precrRNA processing endoribonuclease RAMP protein Cas6 [Myxococcales bacterium]|nr:CRISPR system precrRNA processing endoribonuclease RAMP protein Cas6 [Myxococcales bacterium]
MAAQQWRRFRGERWSSRQRRRHRVEGTLGHARFEGPTARLGQVLRWTEPFGLGEGTALGLGGFVVS